MQGNTPSLRSYLTNKEWLLSSLQYLTGWVLLALFGWAFVLPFFVSNLPTYPLILPVIVVTFFTHATLGIRSTTRRYHIYRPWLDALLLPLWLFACAAFLLTYARLLQ